MRTVANDIVDTLIDKLPILIDNIDLKTTNNKTTIQKKKKKRL